MTKKAIRKSRSEDASPDNFSAMESSQSVPTTQVMTPVMPAHVPAVPVPTTSSSTLTRPLTNGCMVPRGTVRCPPGLDYVYAVDEMFPHTGRPVVRDGWIYSNRKCRTGPRIVQGKLVPAPMSADWQINEVDCTYKRVTSSTDHGIEVTTTSDRPPAPHINKLMKKDLIYKLRNWFEMKLADFFIDNPSNFVSSARVRKRDEDFNKLFGFPDVPRLCICKDPNMDIKWEVDDAAGDTENGMCLDRVAYWKLLQHPLQPNMGDCPMVSNQGIHFPVSPWYRSDMVAQAADIDNIVAFVYSVEVNHDGIMETNVDTNRETACIASITKKGTEFKLGTLIEGQPLAPLLRKYLIDICPDIPNCLEDRKQVDGFEIFKHGTRLISRQVLAVRQKKRQKRVKEDIPYRDVIGFAKPLTLQVLPALIRSSSMNKKEMIELISSLPLLGATMQEANSLPSDSLSDVEWNKLFAAKVEERVKDMFGDNESMETEASSNKQHRGSDSERPSLHLALEEPLPMRPGIEAAIEV